MTYGDDEGKMIRIQYVKSEFNRLIYIMPYFLTAIAGTVLLLVILLFLAKSVIPDALEIKPFRVGLCVEGTDRMSGYVREYVQQMESTENLVEFQEVREEEIEMALQEGEMAACIVIPARTAESIMDGTNIPVQVMMGTGVDNTERYLQQKLISVLTECSAALIDVPQAETLILYELHVENAGELGRMLDLFHFGLVFDRESWFDREEVNAFGSAEVEEYYLAAGLTLLFLFWGIGNGSFLKGQDSYMPLLLKRRGVSFGFQNTISQVVFYLPYLLLVVIMILWMKKVGIVLPFLFLSIMLSLQCSFFFQLAPTAAGGIVFNGIWGIISFFVAGGMLPSVFLPHGLTDIGDKLPAGICMKMLLNMVTGKTVADGKLIGACLLWSVFFGGGGYLLFRRSNHTKYQ